MPRRQVAPKEALIESLSHEGRGLTHIDGKTTFVDAALPGERVMIRSTRRRRRFDDHTHRWRVELISAQVYHHRTAAPVEDTLVRQQVYRQRLSHVAVVVEVQ